MILLKDIKRIGRTGELLNVSDGYALNFLIPKKWGIQATPQELAKYKTRLEKETRETEQVKLLAKKLAVEPLRFVLKTGSHGEVFNSITKDDIIEALKKRGCVDIAIELEKPIRTIGEHSITVHFHHGIKETIIVITAVDK